jgi:predicted DNA-binding ribbon-helix-helix protein
MMAWNIFSSGAGFCFSAAVPRGGLGGAEMKSPVVKRSIRIAGHKTSVSLEDGFWKSLKEIAGERHTSLSDLVAAIETARQHSNLSSAIRLFVLEFYRSQFSAKPGDESSA